MRPITKKEIDQIDYLLENYDEDQIRDKMHEFADQQPYLLVYLLACGDELPKTQQELLLFLGFRIWFSFHHVFDRIPKVSEKLIDSVEEHNMQMLDYFSVEDDAGITEGLTNLLEGYNQKELLTRMVMEIHSDEAELDSMDAQGIFFATLKVSLECLDQ